MLNAGMNNRKTSRMESFLMSMLFGCSLLLFLMYARVVHVDMKMFRVGSRNIGESGVWTANVE